MVDYMEVFEHFGLIDKDTSELIDKDISETYIFDSKKIEHIGKAIAFDLAKGKGRVVIDYDPAYPFAVRRTYTNCPNIPETYKVEVDGDRFVFKPVKPMDPKALTDAVSGMGSERGVIK